MDWAVINNTNNPSDLATIIADAGFHHAGLHIRRPGFLASGTAADWHRDESWHYAGGPSHIIMWANLQPFLLRLKDSPDTAWQPRPGDIVLINNRSVEHRPPLEAIHPDRIFARAWEVTFK